MALHAASELLWRCTIVVGHLLFRAAERLVDDHQSVRDDDLAAEGFGRGVVGKNTRKNETTIRGICAAHECFSPLVSEKNMNWITWLKLLFTAILLTMLVVTIKAGMHENLFQAGRLLNEPWMVATLWDAYCGFVTFYVWVAYKENTLAPRALWFVLIMCLGNIAMAVYVLIQLFRLPANAMMRDLLLRKTAARV